MARALDNKDYDFCISRKWHNVYKSLCKTGHRYHLFDRFTSLYTFCVSVGYTKDMSSPLENTFSLFKLEYVDSETEWPVMLAVAWKKCEENLDIFTDMKRVVQICDEYAEGGMQHLVNEILSDYMDSNQNIMSAKELEFEYNLALFVTEMQNQNILL